MCGFVGFTGTDEQSELVLTAMMNRIIHRGPDMGGQHIVDNVALGFRRLSILDLSEAGAQPMSSDDGKVTIVFNGEIYNFQELRAELEAAGYAFHCNADTEVLVHGYEEWGEDLVNRLRGMYAFVIHDQNKNKLFGARDIFGIKPFYYYQASDGSLLFGSEIKSFLDHPKFEKAVNHDALRPYLTLQFPATEETFFKGVFKLAPAHCFTYDLTTNTMDIKRYWSCDFTDDNSKTFEEYVDECDKVVHESVAAHRIADVKVGSFLSGGVDSSYIAACLMPDTTYSVGFDYKNFNETNYAAELSDKLGIKNVRKMITADEFFDALPDIQYHMDEPQSNLSSVPLYYLAQMASKEVTVVLSGEGADELFAGYEWYEDTPEMRTFKKRVPLGVRHALGSLVQHLPYFKGHNFLTKCAEVPERWYVGQAKVFDPSEVDEVLKPAYNTGKNAAEMCAEYYKQVPDCCELSKKQYLDMNMWLPGDILLKADKMTMAHSLELRVPLLDKELMGVAEQVPTKYLITDENTKYAFRQAAGRHLPKEWYDREKLGFPVPIKKWLREEKFYKYVRSVFERDYVSQFFDQDALLKMIDDNYAGKTDDRRKIWTVYSFLTWYDVYFVHDGEKPDVIAIA